MSSIRSRAGLAVALLAAAFAAHADTTITTNAAFTSDYLFRGISQTWGEPAVQGGADAGFDNGAALGVWTSRFSQRSYPGAAAEIDLYASFGRGFATDWNWRVGVYGYIYPGGNLDAARPHLASRSFDTLEANIALGWKALTLKYNRSLGDYFAIDTEQGYRGDSHGSEYWQLDAALPLADAWSLALHAGYTHIPTSLVAALPSGARDPSYADAGATLKYAFAPHWSASLGLSHANNAAFYSRTVSFENAADTEDLGGTRAFVMLQGTF